MTASVGLLSIRMLLCAQYFIAFFGEEGDQVKVGLAWVFVLHATEMTTHYTIVATPTCFGSPQVCIWIPINKGLLTAM